MYQMNKENTRYYWLIWHPHQRLWNWKLVRGIEKAIPFSLVRKAISYLIIQSDSLLLYLRVVLKRISNVGLGSIFKSVAIDHGKRIIYLDLGTHKKGTELGLMVNSILPQLGKDFIAYGFEASRESFDHVRSRYEGNEKIQLIHKAVFHEIPEGGKLRLYKDMQGGVEDSIYRPSEHFEDVEAIRLSDFIKEHQLIGTNNILLLRMNIEGAEFDVIKDLVETGLSDKIHGYFGMWDDLSKIDLKRDDEFRAYLKQHKISTLPFNGRDLKWNLRVKSIVYDIKTQVLKVLKH